MNQITKTIGIMSTVVAFMLVTIHPVVADPLEGDFYKTVVIVKQKTPDGKQITQIKVTPKTGYHNNMQYPWKLTLKSGPGLPEQLIYKKKDAKKFTEPEVLFEVKTGTTGSEKVKALLKMSLCDDKQCKSVKVDLTW